MVKFMILKVDHPNCFLGQDLSVFEKVNDICIQIKNSNSNILPCGEVIIQKIYLANLFTKIVRVRVLNAINSSVYRCLLVDYGKIEEIQKNRLYNLPLNQLDMDPAVRMIKIPGIRPSGMTNMTIGPNIKMHLSEADKWMPASFKFVSRLFEEDQIVHVNYLRNVSKDKMYADVSVIYGKERVNLKDLLVMQGFAFLIEHELDSSNDQSTVENDNESVYTVADSLENESISSIISNMKINEDSVELSTMLPATYSDYVNNTTLQNTCNGSLDELSLQVLHLKVKCWCVSKSIDFSVNKLGIESIKYEYKDTVRPIVSYKNEQILAEFLKDAMSAFETKFLLLIQAYMLPTILRGVNMVAIAPSRKGKSMGLLMPILQTIATKKLLPSRSYNPLAIILCSTWKKVKDLESSAERFIRYIPESKNCHIPRIVAAYSGSMKKMNMVPILQGCDILIITPTCLLNWLKQFEFFKLNELEIFCLDDAENIIAEHLDVLKEIMIFKRSGAIDRGSEPGQFITATNWTSGLESYVKHELGDVFSIAVNDPLELAVIERMKQKIIEYDDIEGELYQKLAAYLELTESSIKRTIIFANDDNQIALVYKYLMRKARVDLKLLTGSMSSEELHLMTREWNQYRGFVNMPILLISDEALRTSDISIFNADILIHADIHESSFGSRLNFLRDKYSELKFLKPRAEQISLEENEKANSFIFLCPKTINLTTANFLYKFLGRCNCIRPSWLQEKAVDYILTKEISKGCDEICPRIKAFGECKLPGCVKRHMVMSVVDRPLLPNKGHVQFRLLHLDSPTHFFVRIQEFSSPFENGAIYKSQYLSLKMKMSNYFNNTQHIQGFNLRLVQTGVMAAVKIKDVVERVMVTKMKTNKSGRIIVKLIDKGSDMIIEQADLLHLPKELSEISPQAVEVYITGIKPLNNDEYYTDEVCDFVKEFLGDKDLYGVIKLCIGSTLWLDAVTQRIHHQKTNLTVFDKNLSVTLLTKNLVDKNSPHIDRLVRLCTGKIDIWKQNDAENELKPVPIMRKFTYTQKPMIFEQLPLIDDDNQLSTECVLVNVISPNFIFLNNRETIQSIKEMEHEIKLLIDSIEIFPKENIKMDSLVLFFHEDTWKRGCIVSMEKEIGIFSLDWGVIVKYDKNEALLKNLPTEYQQLPYQIILCGLCFCSHSSISYSSDVIQAIQHYARDSNFKRSSSLEVVAYRLEDITSEKFYDDVSENILNLENLNLFSYLKRYSVTLSNKSLPLADEMLHYVLIRNQNILPSLSFVHEILPESQKYASRLVRNGSIPHLASDILCIKENDKRLKISQMIEKIIIKKNELYMASTFIPSKIENIIDTLCVLIIFVNEQSHYMCIYRSLNLLLSLAYENKFILENSDGQKFSVKFITSILLDFKSTNYHMLKHLEISSRSGQVDNCRVILDNLRMLLLDQTMIISLFENNIWCAAMATCIGLVHVDEDVYNLLMDILVQLVMIWKGDYSLLNEILIQCCLVFGKSQSTPVWNSSLSLISCFVNVQSYSQVFRNLNFFETVFDKFIQHYKSIGHWEEIHDNALDILTNMWRNGSACKRDILIRRKLSDDIAFIIKDNLGNSLMCFMNDLLLEESSILKGTDFSSESQSKIPKRNYRYAPDADALDWIEGREISSKKVHKSYRKIFDNSDSETSSDEAKDLESDSDSSDFATIPFLDGNENPANEDNVMCFEKA